jgi:UDP-N-acetylglucosamine--N-acetylmuramyl-(pentapeptide) pyrophosphoryl-undecaprenol N-acetylglucosamine transferase
MGRAFAVIAGGGTAGHVLPAIAIAEALVDAGHAQDTIHYFGARRGIETRLVPPTGFPHHFFDVVGLQRSLARSNLGFAPKMLAAMRVARRQMVVLQPHVVVSVGGYASVPATLAARSLRIPVVVVSYDRKPGRASVLAARSATASAVAFADTKLPRAELTGAPVRRAVLAVDRVGGRAAARQALGIDDDRFFVAVTGGSLGSAALNGAIAAYVAARHDDGQLAVRHVVGERFADLAGPPFSGDDGIRYDVVGFDADLPLSYAAADLLVGRGGAGTVAEVAVTGIPAILVPWSGAAEDHQTLNVAWLAERGAAILLPDAAVDRLGEEIERLRDDPARRAEIGAAAATMGSVHRSGALPALIERAALP